MRGIECAFIGVLSKDPELKKGKNGKNYANFSCTVSSENSEPQWINVICFGSIAEELAQFAHKGDKVYVEGHLSLAKWENADKEARSGLAVSAWKAEKLGCIGKNRVENPRGGHRPTSGDGSPQASFPIVFPAVKKPAFGRLFRKKAKKTQAPADTEIKADAALKSEGKHERPFDDELSF
jgi:single-strand DNA-binding protein